MNVTGEAMGSWLSEFNWDWYATLTFKFEVPNPINAKRYFARWLKDVDKYLGRDSGAFLAVERFKHNFGTHLHTLVRVGLNDSLFNQEVFILPMWDKWFKRYGRAKIEKYDPNLGAGYYVGKYISKELCDFDTFGKWQKLGNKGL